MSGMRGRWGRRIFPMVRRALGEFIARGVEEVEASVGEEDWASSFRGGGGGGGGGDGEEIQRPLLLPPCTHLALTLTVLNSGLCASVERAVRLTPVTRLGGVVLGMEVGTCRRSRNSGGWGGSQGGGGHGGEEQSLGEAVFDIVERAGNCAAGKCGEEGLDEDEVRELVGEFVPNFSRCVQIGSVLQIETMGEGEGEGEGNETASSALREELARIVNSWKSKPGGFRLKPGEVKGYLRLRIKEEEEEEGMEILSGSVNGGLGAGGNGRRQQLWDDRDINAAIASCF